LVGGGYTHRLRNLQMKGIKQMKYVVVKTVTEINMGASAVVHCDTFLYNSAKSAKDKARRMYGEIINGFATIGDLCATSYEESITLSRLVEAKVLGQQTVIVIAVNKVEESEVDDEL
jgi:hypothetical protein